PGSDRSREDGKALAKLCPRAVMALVPRGPLRYGFCGSETPSRNPLIRPREAGKVGSMIRKVYLHRNPNEPGAAFGAGPFLYPHETLHATPRITRRSCS